MQILNIIISTILAVLLAIFLCKRDSETQVTLDITIPVRYQYVLQFYSTLNGADKGKEELICYSDYCYKDPVLLLKRGKLIKRGFLRLPKEQETVLIKMDDIKKITMHIRKNEVM